MREYYGIITLANTISNVTEANRYIGEDHQTLLNDMMAEVSTYSKSSNIEMKKFFVTENVEEYLRTYLDAKTEEYDQTEAYYNEYLETMLSDREPNDTIVREIIEVQRKHLDSIQNILFQTIRKHRQHNMKVHNLRALNMYFESLEK